MNILVTGANGFIGRRVCRRLIESGHQVFGLSLNLPVDSSISFKGYYHQDIAQPFSLEQDFDLVIHLAAYNITNVGAQDQDLYSAININGTRHVLQAAQAKRFIYVSTAKVYRNEGLPVTEESLVSPQGAYAQSKWEAEEICRSLLGKESLVVLRSVNVIGWGQAPKAVLPVFFQKAKANQPLDIINVSQVPMQFVYVEDLVDAMEALIAHEASNGIFNIASQESVHVEQLARMIIAMMHSSSVLNVTKNDVQALLAPVIGDRAYQRLGWRAKTNLNRILELYKDEYDKASS